MHKTFKFSVQSIDKYGDVQQETSFTTPPVEHVEELIPFLESAVTVAGLKPDALRKYYEYCYASRNYPR